MELFTPLQFYMSLHIWEILSETSPMCLDPMVDSAIDDDCAYLILTPPIDLASTASVALRVTYDFDAKRR
jgi:hypothetical protein